MADQYEVECPMPGCTEAIYLEYETSSQFTPGDLTDPLPEFPIGPVEASCQRWKVACLAGHVILVPTEHPGCLCDDSDGPDCLCEQDSYDNYEENRTFRPRDLARLVETVTQLRSLA